MQNKTCLCCYAAFLLSIISQPKTHELTECKLGQRCMCPLPSEPALETVQVLLSRERVEFQSHDWAASVEWESQLTLVEFLPTAAPLWLAHTCACACGGYQLCSARHEGTQHRPSSLLLSPQTHTYADVTPLCFLMICPTLPLQSETMNGMEKWGPTQVCSPHDVFGRRTLEWDLNGRVSKDWNYMTKEDNVIS